MLVNLSVSLSFIFDKNKKVNKKNILVTQEINVACTSDQGNNGPVRKNRNLMQSVGQSRNIFYVIVSSNELLPMSDAFNYFHNLLHQIVEVI